MLEPGKTSGKASALQRKDALKLKPHPWKERVSLSGKKIARLISIEKCVPASCTRLATIQRRLQKEKKKYDKHQIKLRFQFSCTSADWSDDFELMHCHRRQRTGRNN